MKKYTHLAHEEREKLYILHDGHTTLSKIARILKRSTSTISRELARNKTKIGQKPTYLPDKAANLAISRRKNKRKKIESDQHLKSIIIKHLQEDKWSPEIIAQRLKKFHQISISHESIYKFIYSIEGRHHMLYKHLMQQRYTRSISFGRKHRTPIPAIHLIENRPKEINTREEFGHFEGDLTFFKGSNSVNYLVLIERLTRKAFIIYNNNKRSIPTMHNITTLIKSLPSGMVKSITFDNGSEFKKFGVLTLLGVKTYFCKPASPWQKGQVERLNAQLHKYVPKKTNILKVDVDIDDAQNKLNNLPRKILNFLTPDEVWNKFLPEYVALQS